MSQQKVRNPADYISPLSINGLEGRMMHLPAINKNHKREILFIYGHHSSLERWWGLSQAFNKYGAVTVPDLPGFGGMDSMYKVGRVPNLDNLADYLASFVKMRYKRRRVSIVGLSFGFIVVTRMLQRHPELTHKVDALISAAGFVHHDDFRLSPRRQAFYRYGAVVFKNRLLAKVFRYAFLNGPILRAFYSRTHNAKIKFENVDAEHKKKLLDMEVHLWQCNEVRTYMCTTIEMFTLDNCRKKIDLPVWHIYSPNDNYFSNEFVEQHMRIVFSNYNGAPNKTLKHTPSVLADEAEAALLIPSKVREVFLAK